METRTNQNKISEGTHLVGDIKSEGGFRLEGTVDGNLTTPAKVVIGKTGSLKGALQCENADIEGKVTGTLNITGTLTLRGSAVIEGEVHANKLAVEPGATFNASCTMGGAEFKELPQATLELKLDPNAPQRTPIERSRRTKTTPTEQAN